MLKKTALSDIQPLELLHNGGVTSIGMVRTASSRILIEPNSEKSKIVEAEIKKHPNAIFFRAKAIEANAANTNGDYFSEEELFKSYKSFEGVPFFTNHDNQNIENAKGKIIFAEWIPEEKAVYTISFVDRDAYPHIARSIEEEYVTGVSMGCSVEYSVCNICENKAEKTDDYCAHIRNRKGRKFSGKAKNVVTGETKDFKDQLVFEYNYGIKFIELSAVVDPACPSCHIQGIIPNDEYLKRVANIQNSLMMIKTAAIEKQAGQEEIQQLDQVLKTLEEIAIKLIQQRKQVEPEFASDLVQIITELQQWNDELVAAGYGNFQGPAGGAPGGVPGTVGDMPPGGAPGGAPPAGAPVPVSGGAPSAAPTEAVGQTSGSGGNPAVSAPKMPISAPVRPASSSSSIQRISDFSVERIKHGDNILQKAASISNRMDKSGDENMAKRRTISAKLADKEKVVEILTNSWKEKQAFSEYIKEVPSIQDQTTRLSVKKHDDSFIIVAETKESPVVSKVWTFDDLDEEQKETIRQNPQGAAVELLESFANSITNYREGVHNMTDINKAAGANSVNKAPEVVTQKQLDEKGLYHARTGVEQDVVTQKQLDAARTDTEADVVTQKQLDSSIRLNPRTGTEADVVTQKQLNSSRTDTEADVVTQKQLDSSRTGTEAEQTTERQLDKVDAPWARQSKRNPANFKTAADHMNGVIDSLANSVISCGCAPKEVIDVVSDLVGAPKARFDLSNSILEAPVATVDTAQRLAYWKGKNFKIASADAAAIAETVINGLRKLTASETINPDLIVSALDVVSEDKDASWAISKLVDDKLLAGEIVTQKANAKDELRKALKASATEMNQPEREKARLDLLDEVNKAASATPQTRSAERSTWNKKLAGKADTMVEVTFAELGMPVKTAAECRNDKSFKQTIASVTKGALLAKNVKLASITNVTISGNTIQIAVQTDDGEQSVEIPLGGDSGPDNSDVMPEGDLSGEGLDNLAGGSAPMTPMASSKNMKRSAQVPAAGGMPGAPGGSAMPGGAEMGGMPGGAPNTDPIQALTTGDEGMAPEAPADEIPSSSDRQMPLAICPECGSNDVDISKEENGASKGKCNGCGSEYEALIKKTVEFTILKGKEDSQGAGSDGAEPEAPAEVPEVPALPVAAQTRLDRKTIVRIGNNQKANGHVCPACGTKKCKASVDRQGHTEYSCTKCGTDTVKDVLFNEKKPEEAYLRLSWNLFPDVKGCPSCEKKAKELVARIKMEGMLKKASAEKNDFPMTNCMERIARKYGGDTVASYGPCKGKLVSDCVCKELQRLGFRTVRSMERLASASLETDPMEQCMKDQKKNGLDHKQASSICSCVKNKVLAEAKTKDPLVAEAMDNFHLSAFLDDIKTGKEKTLTASQLIALKEIDRESAQKRLEQKIAAKDAELDQDIGAPLPVIVKLKQETKEAMDSKLVTRVASTPTVIETIEKDVSAGVPRKNQTLGKEGPDNIDVPMAKPSVPRGNATMGKEGPDNINPSVGLPDVPRSDAFIGGEAAAQSGLPANNNEIKGTVIAEVSTDSVVKKAKTLKEVDTVENNADVPRKNQTLGEEGKDNIDVAMAKPDVPRKNQTLGEEGADNIDVKENKADVPMGDAYMGDEKNTQKGMPANNDEMLKNVAAGKKREVQLERIAQARFNEALKTASWLAANQRIASDKDTFDNVVKALSNFELGQISKVAEQMFPGKQVKTASASTETREASGYSLPAMVLESKPATTADDFAQRLSAQFTIGSSKFDKDLTLYGEKNKK